MHDYLNEHQRIAVLALEQLKEICDRHNIPFYLLAGSALGAVRHQGMIPWDDDIDVGLTYDNWIRLKKILAQEIKAPFEYLDNDIEIDFPRMIGKILYDRQNCIDIFLLAKWTDNPLLGRIHWRIKRFAIGFHRRSIGYKGHKTPGFKLKLDQRIRTAIMESMISVVYCVIRPFYKTEDYIRLAKWNERFFEEKQTDYYINLYSVYTMQKEMIRREWLEHAQNVEYEGKQYLAIGDIDAYLTHLYGDYMTPPPEKNRIATHGERFTKKAEE